MPSQKSGRATATQPVPTRRSRRQERIARQHPERDLRRASTTGRAKGTPMMLIITAIAIVIGVGVIGYAALTNKAVTGNLSPIQTPGYVTPTTLPQNGLSLGNGPVKVTLYADFQCPGCGSVVRGFEKDLVDKYVANGKITLTHHDSVVNTAIAGNTESLDAANAARCAEDQGKFWQFHDWVYFNQQGEYLGAFSKDRLVEIGKKVGLDPAKFEPCVRNGTHNADVNAMSADWPTDWGQRTTPTFAVNGQKLSGTTYDVVSRAIDAAIAAQNATPAPSASASPSPTATPAPTATPVATNS